MDTPPLEEPPSSRRRRWVAIAVAALAAAVLLAVAGVAAYLAHSNADRARRWEARSKLAEHNASELNALLVARTSELNAKVRALNATAAKVERAQNALSRSESDVSSLVERQRELANEKAQLEDQQAALADVAAAYRQCTDGLTEAIPHIFNSDVAWLDANANAIDGACGEADSAFAGYQSSFGGG